MGRLFRYLPLWLEQQLNRRQCETYSKITTYRLFCLERKTYSTAAESPMNPKMLEKVDAVNEKEGIDINLINHLERTSLVDFDNEEALQRLQEAIKFADTLLEVDTTGVEPLTSVLENETLYLREDKAFPTNREDIIGNAHVTEEDYFVAPPGNIPLEPQSKQFAKKSN